MTRVTRPRTVDLPGSCAHSRTNQSLWLGGCDDLTGWSWVTGSPLDQELISAYPNPGNRGEGRGGSPKKN